MTLSLAWGRYDAIAGTRPITWLPDVIVPEQKFDPITYDRHARRTGDDYILALQYLFPDGQAWPKWDAESNFSKWVEGAAQIWGDVDGRADDLLVRESDPRATMELLPDWERNWGLPDKCVAEPQTIADRRRLLVHRITLLGGQSRQFFLDTADYFGIKAEAIEHSPYMCGISRVGDTTVLTDSGGPRWELGTATLRFYWTIGVAKPRLTWFRVGPGGGEVGVDHMLEIGLMTDLICLFERLKPAHVELAMELHLQELDRWEGTP
jgi:uncharacterized protein YmfQ (DUF2313 family)